MQQSKNIVNIAIFYLDCYTYYTIFYKLYKKLNLNIKIMEDKEKNEIKDAEINEVSEEVSVKKDKNNYRTEIILIFIIGLLLGVMIKAEALKNLSIGFSDYRVKGGAQAYDIVAIEKKMKEEAEMKKAQAEEAAKAGNAGGAGSMQAQPQAGGANSNVQ